jgi:anti-sigma factor RsiW
MSCSPFDLRDYFLKELSPAEKAQLDSHLKICAGCREELDGLQMTQAALFSLRDEEIPQRIAFVSDKIFEPSPLRRWLEGFWGSTARLGFASAALLACSILYFAATRPAPAPNRPAVIEKVTAEATKQGPSPAEVQQQIQQAVAAAVAQVEARQSEKTARVVADLERRTDEMRRSLQLAADQYELDRKRQQRNERMAMVSGGESR